MKAAIIGGGFAGCMHVSALRSIGVKVEAVVTRREDSSRAFAEQWGIPFWGCDPELALREDIDAVHICTPAASHPFFIREALRSGKDVFCEKPLCTDPGQAAEIVSLAEESRKKCAVNYNVRYHMAIQRARELIAGGSLGRVLLIHGCYLQEFHILPAPYDWRYDPETAGSMRAVTEIGSHWIDTAQYVSGKQVTAASAQFGNFFPDRVVRDGMMESAEACVRDGMMESAEACVRDGMMENSEACAGDGGKRIRVTSEDAACISFRYEDGAIGNVMLSEISPGRGNRLALEITCENGSVWWNAEENNILHTAVKGEGVRSQFFAFGNGFGDTVASAMKKFYEGTDYPTFSEAARTVRVCTAIEKSARSESEWVKV